MFTDTHTHLYLEQFDKDRKQIITDAIKEGVEYMLLPNIDSSSISGMMKICNDFPENCFPMIGLHPTSVKSNYKEELEIVENKLSDKNFIAIGEIGIDLYWDKTYKREQETALRYQIELAKKNKIPVVIHTRNSFSEIFEIMEDVISTELNGVFHCFTGNIEDAERIIDLGFKIGIGGVLTFKNSGLDKVVQEIDLEHILLETDSPYLAPVPFRGKRNSSAYIPYIANKIAEIKNIPIKEVSEITTYNAISLFRFI
ncbi:MAG: TatD family hydrolase [Bacteroidales bacterium]|nr:TatD family hydrolase [Bacteroidales bacterium]